MHIARAVILHCLGLDRLLRDGQVESDLHVVASGGADLAHHADFHRGNGPPRVAVGDFRQVRERVVGGLDVILPQAAVGIGEDAPQQLDNVGLAERLEAEDRRAAQQGRVDREKRILRRRADQKDHSVLDIAQQNILLRAIETVQFVDEEHRPPPDAGEQDAGLFDNLAHLAHRSRRGVEHVEFTITMQGDHRSERGLARPRRAEEYQRTETIRLEHPPQHLARPEEFVLPEHLVEGSRAHADGQWRMGRNRRTFGFVEQIHFAP